MHAQAHSRRSARRQALLRERAAYMRTAGTDSERRLWSALVNGKLGVSFRRQAVVAGCIVDFMAPSVRLVVEVDGPYHERRRRADARRDEKLRRLGYRVLRVEADVVMRDLGRAVAVVREKIETFQV